MRTRLNNLKILYDSASGEIPIQRERLDDYWTIIFSIEQLSYLLEELSKEEIRPVFSDTLFSQLLFTCEMLAHPPNETYLLSDQYIPDVDVYRC